jgi:hypothetical protein
VMTIHAAAKVEGAAVSVDMRAPAVMLQRSIG